MGNIYHQDSQRLHELLDRSSALSGATLLIPDLQRPYVWTPNQVVLLIDSLIRGWPFGTLLLWKVNHHELEGIPYRPFWTVVNRVGDANGAQVAQMNPPAEYHMVLDGQQRIQSLLLALGGDDWGFKLEDRDWTEEIKEQRPRGRQTKYQHWSKASLCLDLWKFNDEYLNQGSSLSAVDFRNVLTWAITDPQKGQSPYPKPENYADPLPKAYQNPKQLVRLSRLWKEARPNAALMQAQFETILRTVLTQHGLTIGEIDPLLRPLGELMITLRNVKLAEVTYLELQPYDEQMWTLDVYNDAVVNIFTRLNRAGRALEPEEITFAWLKVGWDTGLTSGKSAGDCFSSLRSQLSELGLALDMDELVSAASFVWAVSHNEGRPLANSDLLKGTVIRPMAADLSKEWSLVQSAFVLGAETLKERSLEYGQRGQFSSLYALAVLWAWIYIAKRWRSEHYLGELARDDFDKRCNNSIAKYLDRWIMCSQWAGVWSGASTRTIETYARNLSEAQKAVCQLSDLEEAHYAWDARFANLFDNLIDNATNYINTVNAPTRDRVALYRGPLWTWHRLDAERWATSQAILRVGKSKPVIEVDHIVAFGLWEKKIAGAKDMDRDETLASVNRLGNCALLEKNFNISKSDRALDRFLSQIYEIKQEMIRKDAWCAALSISQRLLDPETATIQDVIDAIENRDKEIRAELVEFVRGQRVRTDVLTPTGVTEVAKMAAAAAQSSTARISSPPIHPAFQSVIDSSDGDSESEEDEQPILPGPRIDCNGLHTAYEEDPAVRLILDHFAGRQRNQNTTDIDALLGALERAGSRCERSDLIRAFRRLDALGVGRFVPGRRGHPTRFEWREKSLTVRHLALGAGQQPQA